MSLKTLLFNGPIIRQRADNLEMANRILRLGIASILSFLLENNIEAQLVDPVTQNEFEIKKKIKKFQPGLVGINAYTSEVHAAAATAAWVKSIYPKAKVVIGGPHASAVPQRTLKEFSSFDIAAIGEGEQTMLEIADNRRSLSDIAGICFRSNTRIIINPPRTLIENINALPYPPWELYQLQNYSGSNLASGFAARINLFRRNYKNLELPVEGARGCPFGCIFCYRTMGRTMRYKSAQRIVDEVQRNVEKFGATQIHFIEGTFGVNQKIAQEMCEELIKRNLHRKIRWASGGRVNLLLNKELINLMKQSGCNYLGIGVESGDEEILEKIGKGININQIKRAFRLCHEAGITTEAEFILGHPFETEETIRKTINLACSLPTRYATFAILVPFPGTEVAQMAKKHVGGLKILTEDWRVYGKQIGKSLELKQLPHEKLLEHQAAAYRKFYMRPSHIPALVSRLNKDRIMYGIKNVFGKLT
ncbi:hypothetical protein B5M47_00280 [candidate division CPR3 bacterium 4484_211]|uniref:Uncharacterized protein n=1 Tax=candidate division CPR3 bacterium 4484_211 TaxID=1968527 RepID=A0A1W9NZG5_UNCC3|nr:MAG: hypothetical protein B5M47_00280 [candidate division CPR3 bacterium 4484_211]